MHRNSKKANPPWKEIYYDLYGQQFVLAVNWEGARACGWWVAANPLRMCIHLLQIHIDAELLHIPCLSMSIPEWSKPVWVIIIRFMWNFLAPITGLHSAPQAGELLGNNQWHNWTGKNHSRLYPNFMTHIKLIFYQVAQLLMLSVWGNYHSGQKPE